MTCWDIIIRVSLEHCIRLHHLSEREVSYVFYSSKDNIHICWPHLFKNSHHLSFQSIDGDQQHVFSVFKYQIFELEHDIIQRLGILISHYWVVWASSLLLILFILNGDNLWCLCHCHLVCYCSCKLWCTGSQPVVGDTGCGLHKSKVQTENVWCQNPAFIGFGLHMPFGPC